MMIGRKSPELCCLMRRAASKVHARQHRVHEYEIRRAGDGELDGLLAVLRPIVS
jgi:hypothetical protein